MAVFLFVRWLVFFVYLFTRDLDKKVYEVEYHGAVCCLKNGGASSLDNVYSEPSVVAGGAYSVLCGGRPRAVLQDCRYRRELAFGTAVPFWGQTHSISEYFVFKTKLQFAFEGLK